MNCLANAMYHEINKGYKHEQFPLAICQSMQYCNIAKSMNGAPREFCHLDENNEESSLQQETAP
jgi:hypothetical protein